MMRMRNSVLAMAAAAAVTACGGGGADGSGAVSTIEVDGSSTVYPITEAVAEEFGREGGSARVTIGFSGTGGGFKRFCAGETQISNASRPIKDSERDLCMQNGIEFVELPVAIDGLAVVVNRQNDFVECVTVEELRRLWEPGSTIARWSQLRDGWPNEQMKLYGPGTNSGTFDYFTEAIMGESGASRGDYTASEDDNVLVQGVVGDRSAIGYFGYAYYIENEGRMKPVAVDNGSGCILPNEATVKSGQYAPLSRPLFIYVSRTALNRADVVEFIEYYMQVAPELVTEVGYIPLELAEYQANIERLERGGAS